MARFCIERLHPTSPAQPDVHDKRITINIPDIAEGIETWTDVFSWIASNPKPPECFHSALLVLCTCFSRFPKAP